MAENILEAFVVKRSKILLPALNSGISGSKNTFWRFSIDRKIVHKGILIEATDKTVEGYYLYGTEIPVIFSYPNTWEKTEPKMKPCIGVETRQWEISKSRKIDHLDGSFQYQGKYITDEDVIAWLENERNIESMKRVKEWAIQYGEKCKELLEAINNRRREQRINGAVNQYSEYLDKEENAEKIKKMIARRDELISRYQ